MEDPKKQFVANPKFLQCKYGPSIPTYVVKMASRNQQL